MAHMVKIRSSPAALRRAVGRGEPVAPRSLFAIRTRNIATNAAIQEPGVEYPGVVPPVPLTPQLNAQDRREAIKKAKPFSDFLTDTFNRQHDYLRISITERCNLRCLYCMPEEGIPLSPNANMLTTPEIFYLSSLFVSQGVTKIRLTGGEPTVRRDIVPLMQQIGSLRPKGLRELALTTNGISLHRKLDAMVEAGLTGVNLSLDTLDPFQFQIMTRRKGFDAVMKSIDRILEMNKLGANIKLKVNCVVMRGLNEREILPFVEMGREKDIEVRFIEYMPFGGNKWSQGKMISFQEMLDIIRTKYPALRPVPGHKNDTSKTYEVPGFVGKVGFITSMTNDFCGTCNRLRITSDGNLKVCLHGNAEVSLRDVLRQGNNGEPIDQEAFERIKQLEMDRHEGRLSDETILGWGQRERELLDVVGAAVKRKAEKHADLDDLANMENRPMILIDNNKSFSSQSTQWPARPTRPHQPLGPSPILRGRPSMASSSMPYLYASLIPAMTTVRAFSTSQPLAEPKWKKRHRRKAEIENMPGFTMMGSRPDTIRDRSIMIKWKTSVKGVLPPSLEEVGQKYNLRGTTFDGYWYRVADVKLADTEAKRKEAHYKAQKKLSQTSGNQGLKHLDLMQEAQEFADRDWESGEWRNWRPPRPTTEEGGTVAQQKTEESEKTTSADATQKDLEQQHEMGESGPLMPGADAAQKDAEQQQEMESPNEQASDAITTQQTAPEQSLQNTPDLTAFLEEVNVPQQSDRRIKKIEEKIRELKRRIAHIAGRKQWVPIPTSTESLTKSGELLTSRAAWRAKKKVAVLEEKFETKRAQELDELNSQILVHKEEIDAILQQNQLLDDVRRRKQEMLEKKRALLKQLHESPTLDKTAESTATNVSSGNDSSDIDSILEEALKNKKQSQKPKTTKPPPQLVRETPPLVRRLGVPHIHILEQSTTEAKDVISTKEEALTDPIMDRENSRTPPESADPISPRWPTLKDTSQSTPAQDALQSSRAAQRRPSDNLRLNVSPAGFIPIDADLIVSLEGSIPKLQDQVYEMQKRLKASYPRIDNLPYPVWKSNNQRTLQTWLKILVSKWQTRFADAGQNGHVETDIVDENVQAVLDQMVRDHDLGNEAAERMAMRWHEVFDQRGAMTGDAEGVLDWDEFQAGGMGFLGNESEAFESSPQENEAKAIPLTEKPAAQSTNQTSTYGSISRRSYSTSTRPPRGPAPTSVEETTNEARPVSEATAAPALPHLTASGSAHMVSVSAKAHTSRTAIAIGTIYFSNPTPLSLIRSNTLKKGDVLGVSRIAGIMASKKCPDIVPLCHPIMLTHVGVELKPFGPPSNSSSEKERRDDSSEAIDSDDLGFGGVMIEAKVQCEGQTGVEMEAMTAVMGAALSVVDMCKAVDKFQRIGGVRVVVKEGGKSGVWREEGWRSWQV